MTENLPENFSIRSYKPDDYSQLRELYMQTELYGGQFDENRDAEERLRKHIEVNPDAILIAMLDGVAIGTVSFIDDGRVAWLFRFAVTKNEIEEQVTKALSEAALRALKARGHDQVLVYTPVDDSRLRQRYASLGFSKGNDYTCYWKDIA